MEPEIEKFEISEEDLYNEFNPERRSFRQSKNQAIYGIWAADESDEEERPSFGGLGGKGKKNYTAPINFMSGGFKKGSKEEKEANRKEKDVYDEDDGDGGPKYSDSDDEGSGFPTAFGGGASRRQTKKKQYGGRTGFAGQGGYGGRGGFHGGNDEFGNWEKHTRGIGAKLLQKMGHVPGKGLGKNLHGIVNPVTAKKRAGKAALGFYGDERTEQAKRDFPQIDSEEEEEKEFKKQLQQWKKTTVDKKKKPKYVYKTVDEVLEKGGKVKGPGRSEMSKVKVIDMTTKDQRVLSGYHAISRRHDRPESDEDDVPATVVQRAFDMPELLHNLDLLCDMAEEDIIQNDRQLRYEKDMVINMTHEKEKMTEVCAHEEKQIDRLQQVLNLIESCEARTKEGCTDPITLDEAALVFQRLQDEFYEEYKMYDLALLAVGMVFPLVKKYFSIWNPLLQPQYGLDTMKRWKDILEDPNRHFSQGDMDPYQRLIWEVWMPYLRTAINGWSVRNCDPLIELLENWMPFLPPWIMNNIQDQLIMPKLTREVESWNPLTDTMPIHSWIHPWLPMMGPKLNSLYAPVRHKLANALKNWHPSDPSAKMILQPWKGVFSEGHMNAFVVKNILPKLGVCMQEFVINPHQQHLDGWNWVMAWKDMLPTANLASLLERFFFPKWLQVLCTWLSSNPNYDEVTKWYTGWKSMLSEQLLAMPAIKEQLNRALEIMNRAVSGNFQPGARENVAYLTQTERRRDFELQAAKEKRAYEEYEAVKGSGSAAGIPANFKDLIERKAEENGLLFMPIPNRTYEAKQVYKFGNIVIYLDRGVIFVQDSVGYVPMSLQGLVEKAKGS